MWPRRDGRGDDLSGTRNGVGTNKLQCGRGAMAAVTPVALRERLLLRELQCGRGAMAAVTAVTVHRHRDERPRFNVAAARWPR